MKTLVVYYSYFGKTKAAASCLADQIGADLVELAPVGLRIRPFALMEGAVRAGQPAPAIKGLIRRYAFYRKEVCGMLTCSSDGRRAMSALRKELEDAGARCANVIAIRMEPAMLEALRGGELRFLSQENGKLALEAVKEDSSAGSTLAKDYSTED